MTLALLILSMASAFVGFFTLKSAFRYWEADGAFTPLAAGLSLSLLALVFLIMAGRRFWKARARAKNGGGLYL